MIERLAEQFPQLYLAPENGGSKSPLFRSITKEGTEYRGTLDHFVTSPQDRFQAVHTPVGTVETYTFGAREDFVTAVRCLRDRCECTDIPDTLEYLVISGLTDWGKVRKHKKDYLSTGCTDWDREQKRFLENREKCTTQVILLCEGFYHRLSPESVGMTEATWKNVSGVIRKYHALYDYWREKKWTALRNPKWDGIFGDCVGIVAALRRYDENLAYKLLPPEEEAFRRAVEDLSEAVCCWGGSDPYKLIRYVYEQTELYTTEI